MNEPIINNPKFEAAFSNFIASLRNSDSLSSVMLLLIAETALHCCGS